MKLKVNPNYPDNICHISTVRNLCAGTMYTLFKDEAVDVPDADAEVLLKSDPHAVVVADGATKTVQPAEQPLTEYVSILEDLANIELDLLSMNQLSVYYEKLGRKVPRPINKRSLIQLIDERCSEITNELEAIK